MRSFRNPLKLFLAWFVFGAMLTHGACAQEAPVNSPYFPLAVGNSWTYRCSVEGEFQRMKRFVISGVMQTQGRQVFRLEMRLSNRPRPLVSYLFVTPDGLVMSALSATLEDAEPLISASPKLNQSFGDLKVVKIGRSDIKKYAKVKTVFLENYSGEAPGLSQEQYLAWRGKHYGQGIGLLVEADGAGADCELSTYRVKPAKKR